MIVLLCLLHKCISPQLGTPGCPSLKSLSPLQGWHIAASSAHVPRPQSPPKELGQRRHIAVIWTREKDLVPGGCWRFPWERFLSSWSCSMCIFQSLVATSGPALGSKGSDFLYSRKYIRNGWVDCAFWGIALVVVLCAQAQFRFIGQGNTSFVAQMRKLILSPYSTGLYR